MTIISRFNFSDNKQITAQISDELTNHLWTAFAQNSNGVCYLKKQSCLSPNQNYYTLNRYVTSINALDYDASNIYVAYSDITYLGEIISKINPLTSTIYISKGYFQESPVDIKVNGTDVFFLLPGNITGETAKLVKYNISGVLQNTIELSPIINAKSMVLKQTLYDGVPVDGNTTLLLHCNGIDGSTTFTDLSASPHTITPIGNTQIDTEQYVFGQASALFDGVGDYLSSPDHTDWDFGSGNFSIDFRVRFSDSTGNQGFFGRYTNSGSYFYIAKEGNSIRIRDLGGTLDSTIGWTPSIDRWYHIAIIRDGNNIKVFVDGTQLGSTISFSSSLLDRSVPLYIGTAFSDSYYLKGWMDDIRISKGFARWTSNFVISQGIGKDIWIVTYENPVKVIRVFESFTNVYGFETTDII